METCYHISDIDQIRSPALVVYPDIVQSNINKLVGSIDDVSRLRPHIKTHKCQEAIMMCREAGISKFKCATIAEAALLGQCRVPDVLLAYQPVGPNEPAFISLITKYPDTQFACLIDDLHIAQHLNILANEYSLSLSVYIDLNIGMNRTGIAPQKAFTLYQECLALPSLIVKGLHAYDGHIHDSDIKVREQKVAAGFTAVAELIKMLKEIGEEPQLIAGGSPTFPIHAGFDDRECSPGTFIYWDKGYMDAFAEQTFSPAALVITRVISLPDDHSICVDLGHKAIASERNLNERVVFLNAPKLRCIAHSEEHLVLDAGPDHAFRIGDVLYGLPYHICPTVALHERAITIVNNRISGEWKTVARDRNFF